MRRTSRPAGPAAAVSGAVACLLLTLPACHAPPAGRQAAELRLGVAAFDTVDPLASVEHLAALGFDYIEPALSRLAAMPDAEVAAARARVRGAGLTAEAMNWFVPGELKLTGPAVDLVRVRAYVERALGIAASFGTRVIVFGSPAARSFPEGYSRDEALRQLVTFLRLCDEVIQDHAFDLVIAIEPLRRAESNLVNRVAEAVDLARAVDRRSVRIVVDFYHVACEGEAPEVVRQAKDWVVHVQVAEPAQRGFPRAGRDEALFSRIVASLRAIEYRGRISIEAKSADLPGDARAGLALLRGLITVP